MAKHFPFAWFHSLTGQVQNDGTTKPGLTKPVQGGTDCDATHIANLDSAAPGSKTSGLYQDLQTRIHHAGVQLDHSGQLQ